MYLKELEATVLEQATKTKELRLEEDKLKSEICTVIKNNIENIVVPYLNRMNGFLKRVRELTDSVPKFTEYNDEIPLGADIDNCYKLHLVVSSYAVHLSFKYFGSYGWNKYLDYSEAEDVYRYRNHYNLRHVFINEEDTQKVVDLIQKKYELIFTAWSESTRTWNEELANKIADMRDALSKSHCVEHNEDGTVEIHLGDKVYRGTLIED